MVEDQEVLVDDSPPWWCILSWRRLLWCCWCSWLWWSLYFIMNACMHEGRFQDGFSNTHQSSTIHWCVLEQVLSRRHSCAFESVPASTHFWKNCRGLSKVCASSSVPMFFSVGAPPCRWLYGVPAGDWVSSLALVGSLALSSLVSPSLFPSLSISLVYYYYTQECECILFYIQ